LPVVQFTVEKDKKQKRIMECGSVSTGAGGPPGIRQRRKKDFILSKDLPEQDRIRRILRVAIGL
jgi:hypothetical protein